MIHDVAEGWISKARAREVYGVVIDDAMQVDDTATRQLRARVSAASSDANPTNGRL